MIDFKNIEGIYFVGIGGIGMSALAFYFIKAGYAVAGYDRSESLISKSLAELGCSVAYQDNISELPSLFGNVADRDRVIIVYTGFRHQSLCIEGPALSIAVEASDTLE